ASKSLLFSQILGSARDSSPAFGGAGKRAGAFCAVSVQCAKAALTFVASKGSSPRTMRLIAPRFCPFPFIKDLRWERGSDWATTAVTPAATATTARTVRIISLAPSVDRSPSRTLRAWQFPSDTRNINAHSDILARNASLWSKRKFVLSEWRRKLKGENLAFT